MSKWRGLERIERDLAERSDAWRRDKRIAISDAMPTLVDRRPAKPVAESNQPEARFVRFFDPKVQS